MTTQNEEHEKAQAELLAAKAKLEAAPARALQEHDEEVRRIAAAYDLKQVDVIRLSGYTRETVRQAMDPEIRAAAQKAAKARHAARRGAK